VRGAVERENDAVPEEGLPVALPLPTITPQASGDGQGESEGQGARMRIIRLTTMMTAIFSKGLISLVIRPTCPP